LKSSKGQDVTGLLEKAGYYPLLFFSLENPNSCVLVRSVRIPSSQRKLLKDWADASHSATPTAPATMSKSLLKVEYEKIKPAISQKLESAVKMPLNATSTVSLNLGLETEITSWETQSTMKTLEWLE
jgi:serine/threonine-protein kinase